MQKVYHSTKTAISSFLDRGSLLLNFATVSVSGVTLLWLLLLPPKFNFTPSHDPQVLRVNFQNVGQGDSTFFIAPNGNSFLLDAGPFGNSALEEVGKNISIFDKHISVIAGTHGDSDHVGGFESVLESYSTSLYVDPGLNSDTSIYKNLIKKNLELGIENFIARKGVQIILDQESVVVFETLFPDMSYVVEKYKTCVLVKTKKEVSKTKSKRAKSNKVKTNKAESTKAKNKTKKKKIVQVDNSVAQNINHNCSKQLLVDTNEFSIVGQMRYGSTSIMMTGDAPVSVEEYLVRTFSKNKIENKFNARSASSTLNSGLKSQILKVGHHGSKTSTSQNFVNETDPDFAIISVGKNNRYSHPNKGVLLLLEEFMRRKFQRGATSLKPDSTKTEKSETETSEQILRTDTIGHSIEFISDGKSFVRVK